MSGSKPKWPEQLTNTHHVVVNSINQTWKYGSDYRSAEKLCQEDGNLNLGSVGGNEHFSGPAEVKL